MLLGSWHYHLLSNGVFFPRFWDIESSYLANRITLAQLIRVSVDKNEAFIDHFQMVDPLRYFHVAGLSCST